VDGFAGDTVEYDSPRPMNLERGPKGRSSTTAQAEMQMHVFGLHSVVLGYQRWPDRIEEGAC
jgi:hypothetical protein